MSRAKTNVNTLNDIVGDGGAGLVGYLPAGTGAVSSDVQSKLRETVSVKDFGAVGDGSDESAKVQAWLNYLVANKKRGYAPAGIYYCPTTVVKAPSFFCPTISGDGQSMTIFKSAPGGTASLNIVGGSGVSCGAVISGITFDGNETGYGVEICGQGGVTFRDCEFTNAAVGVLPHNRDSGSFTEYVVADNCLFTESCKQAIVYKRTSGNDSFHGTGLRNCQINESTAETKPKIEIGGALSTNQDISVYNAPLSFQIWKQTATAVLVNNTTRFSTNFHGSITLELFGTADATTWNFCNNTRNTYFLGTISSLQNKTQRGTLVLCDTFETKPDGTVSALLKPYKIEALAMVSGANTIASIPGSTTETYFVRLRFADSASAARKVYLLAVNLDVTGVHTVTTISQLEDYYGGSMPYPTFSMSGQSLVATAAFATTVSCTGTISKIGIGEAFGL